MKIVLAMVCAALVVILAAGAAVAVLTGDLLGAALYTAGAFIITICLWRLTDVNDPNERIGRG